jgi:hypothetical protein
MLVARIAIAVGFDGRRCVSVDGVGGGDERIEAIE